MKLRDLIESFCMEHKEYRFETDYCGKTVDTAKCIGISIPKEESYMELLLALTEYLDSQQFEDMDLELLNPAVDEFTDRVVVYFPNCQNATALAAATLRESTP